MRAKGTLWLQPARRRRYVFHLSGRRRCECRAEGLWDGPPATRLVLIGQRRGPLVALRDGLLAGCVAGRCGCVGPPAAAAGGRDIRGCEAGDSYPAAAEFRRLVAEHPRFHLVGAEPEAGATAAAAAEAARGGEASGGGGAGLVEFSCNSMPLQGIVGDVVSG